MQPVHAVLAQVGGIEASQIFEIIKSGGWALSPFLFWLWLRESTERRSLQSKLDSLSERTLILMTELKGLFKGKPR